MNGNKGETSLQTGMNSAGKINDEILKMEFDRLYGLFEKSEEFGEKRTTLMITITGVLFGSFFALLKSSPDYFFSHAFIFWLMIIAMIFLLALGGLTLLRMAHRNLTTDEYKEAIKLIKTFYVSETPGLNQYLFFGAKEDHKNRNAADFKGGYIEIIKLINSILTGLFIYMLVNYLNAIMQSADTGMHIAFIFGIALAGSVLSWIAQRKYTERIYNIGFKKCEEKLEKLGVGDEK